MEEVLALEHLLPVEADDKVEVGIAFLNGSLHLVSIHLWIVHGVIPDRECRARRIANEPVGVICVEKLTGKLAICTEREVPWCAVILHGPEIEGAKFLEVEVPSSFVGALKKCAFSINLSKGGCGSDGPH